MAPLIWCMPVSPRDSQGGVGAHHPRAGPVPRPAPARGSGGSGQVPGGGARGGAGGAAGRQEGEERRGGVGLGLWGLSYHQICRST